MSPATADTKTLRSLQDAVQMFRSTPVDEGHDLLKHDLAF